MNVDCYSIVSFPKDDFTNRNLGYVFIALTSNQALYRLIESVRIERGIDSRCKISPGLTVRVLSTATFAILSFYKRISMIRRIRK